MAPIEIEALNPLSDPGEPDGLYEVVDGRFVEKSTGVYENWLAGVIFGEINRYAEANPIGRSVIQMIFDLRPRVDRERRPDVAFISLERWERGRGVPRAHSWTVIPDLAVKIISLTTKTYEVVEKLEEYFDVGVRRVWVVYPRQTKIYDYSSTTAVRILAPGDELDGGQVLPGFRLSVTDLFEKAGEPA
jgi:Uma2 family endonuclease